MKIPRILLAAGASGSGKTLITCGILQALVDRGIPTASFKCGPDFIDPMFHSRVIGTRSRNLDTFFTSPEVTRYLLGKNAGECRIAVMEGVMGYYDGVGGTTSRASAYDLASVTDTPVIFIVNSKGMSVSLAAYVKGFLEYKNDSRIKGVILNQMSPMLYPRMKALLEKELGIAVLGYVPKVEDCVIESRHLGLVLPDEIPELQGRLKKLAGILEETLDIEKILALADSAPELDTGFQADRKSCAKETEADVFDLCDQKILKNKPTGSETVSVRIGVAKDESFCFFYEDNFRLLKEMGAELVFFSPMHDDHLPENLDGLLLYGGYPELNGPVLEKNVSMRKEIAGKIARGMPCMAECGGFMYLHEEMEGMDGGIYRMAGVIPGRAFRTPRLSRFGYILLKQKKTVLGSDDLGMIPAHEFHYFDSENCGGDFMAEKPESSRSWECIHGTETMLAGYPHLYYYGNPKVPEAFLRQCAVYKKREAS